MARYVGRHGTERVRSCVFIESLAPTFVKSDANPSGVDEAAVEGVQQAILDDRFAWLTDLLSNFLNRDDPNARAVSEETLRDAWSAGAYASPRATWACVPGWLDDFSEDVKRLDVPTLILHGTADRILAIDGHGRRLHAALPESTLVEIEGGPHLVCVTHAKEVNRELLAFLRQAAPAGAAV
jgi:pimeloyl-ACP methyl ester carboxylesterase